MTEQSRREQRAGMERQEVRRVGVRGKEKRREGERRVKGGGGKARKARTGEQRVRVKV